MIMAGLREELTTETQRTQRKTQRKWESEKVCLILLFLRGFLCVLCDPVVQFHSLTVDIGNEPSTLTSSHSSCKLDSTRLTLGSSVCPSKSMKNRYDGLPPRAGNDSIHVRLTLACL